MTTLTTAPPAVIPAPRRTSEGGRGKHRQTSKPAKAVRTAKGKVGEALLTLAALLGLATMGLTLFAAQSGLQPLVVKSGSMEPTIHTGGMVLMRKVPAADIRVGDVLAVERPDRTRVTHRVVTVKHMGATAELTLKGDANEDPDPIPVTVSEAGRLVHTLPMIGRGSAFLASAKGGFVLGCLITAIALTTLRRRSA